MSSGSTIPKKGPWPYLTRENYIDIIPAYTEALADLLQSEPAQVAASLRALDEARRIAASVPRMASGEAGNSPSSAAYLKRYVRFPDGRFTAKPAVVVAGTGGGSGGTNTVSFHVGGVSARGFDCWVWAAPGVTLAGSWTGFSWVAVQQG